ncbi:hypothetical protein [Kitasatospora sp. NPDC047058]|uniref:hypothetical protein n=1 Tax=Kitasatospora sp. NPDC047058 TaxID=3155620 RepID=UPI0034104F7E
MTADVTTSSMEEENLRDLAALTGATPEELLRQHAAGDLPVPTEPAPPEAWAFLDGPEDLAATTEEHLRRWDGR